MSEKIAKEGKEKKSFKTVIIAIVIVLAICGGAFGGYMLVNKNIIGGNNTQAVNNNGSQVSSTQTAAQVTVNGMVQPVISDFTFELGEFLVNLSDDQEKRFVKTSIYIGYSNKRLAKELESRKPMIRDAINSVLREKKAKDFTQKGIEDIKLEILNRINPMFNEGRCESIYFNEILVQ